MRDGEVNELWPWERGPGGELTLTGRFRGYVGETFLALEEMESFMRRFGLRDAGARRPAV